MVARVELNPRRPDAQGTDRSLITARAASRILDAVVGLAALLAVTCVLWRIGDGFDLTDEASYVQAADPPHHGDAFNGFFGLYLRPVWQLAHWDVTAVRVVGLVGLLAAAALLGWSTARLTGLRARPVVAVTAAAATGYYGAGLRTPSYNWLALLGAVLVSVALLRLLAGATAWWGAAAGAAAAVAAVGKITTGALLAVLAAAVPALTRRPRALAAFAAALGGAVLVHVVTVLPASESARVLRRSAAVLGAFDPQHYTALGSAAAVAGQVPVLALVALLGALLGYAPAVLAPPAPRREAWFARHCAVAVVVVTVVVLVARVWSGGFDNGVDLGSGVLPVLAAIGGAVAAARTPHLDRCLEMPRPERAGDAATARLGAAVAVLAVGAVACAVGSNVSLGWVLGTTGTVLLVPACLVACQALPVRAAAASTAALLVALAVGAVVVSVEAQRDPKRSAPLAVATAPVDVGPVTVRVDRGSATALRELVSAARGAGWRPGTRLVDTTYTPAVPLALGAVVPHVLLPGFPGLSPASVCTALATEPREAPGWRDAWLLVPRDSARDDLARAAACLGRRWPDDYDPVTSFTTPWINVPTLLLRPR